MADDTEVLQRRMAELRRENGLLRSIQGGGAGNLQLLAENIRLRREIETMRVETVPTFCPYTGPAPLTLDELEVLPAPWREKALAAMPPAEARALEARSGLLRDLAEQDRLAAERRRVLADLPDQTIEEFNALPAARRSALAHAMTERQRRVLTGAADRTDRAGAEAEGWL